MNAVRLLSTDSAQNALNLANQLNEINSQRQDLTIESLDHAYRTIEDQGIENLIFLYNENWEEGIVGLIAGKVHERYNRPTLVATKKTGEAEWVGSARSNESVHITDLISTQEEFLTRFGGHAQAAGFSFLEESLEDFKESIIQEANKSISKKDLVKIASFDMQLPINQISEKLIHEIELLAPFGMGNPTPKFLFEDLQIRSTKLIGKTQKHLKMYSNGSKVELLWFNLPEEKKQLLTNSTSHRKSHNFLGTLGYNEWNRQKFLQIKISDHDSK
jgi:single-stranded-DNA-specific exonuclease